MARWHFCGASGTGPLSDREAASNPVDALKRLKPDQRHWYPPTKEKFAEIIESIRTQRKSHSLAAAMAVEFLAYTGMRISEAQAVTWGDVRDGHIVRRIAKNDAMGKIPLIPAALASAGAHEARQTCHVSQEIR